MYYALIVIATLLVALQFLFTEKYQECHGSDISISIDFSVLTSFIGFIFILATSKFNVQFTFFSFMLAFLSAISTMLFFWCSFKSFKHVNLSVYSVFAMLGGMIVPTLVGILFYREALTIPIIISCILVFLSLFVTVDFKKGNKLQYFYYMLVFILNGAGGALSKVHQSAPTLNVDSNSFLAITYILVIILGMIIKFCIGKKTIACNKKSLLFASGCSIAMTIGNLFILIALLNVPVSISSPLTTGGVIVFSAIIGAFKGQRLKLSDYVSVALAIAASVIIVL